MYLHYDMIRDLIYFHDRINNFFEERLKRIYTATEINDGTVWFPAVDICETETEFILAAELPGVKLEEVRIEVFHNELVLTGSRPFPREGVNREDYYRLEGSYGLFERRFPLPAAVDRENISASLKNGVLKVTIPKVGGGRVTRIAIGNP